MKMYIHMKFGQKIEQVASERMKYMIFLTFNLIFEI